MENLKKIKKVHFVGVGGAGMSGLAKVLQQKGIRVSGSDIKESPNTKNLQKLGVEISIGHDKDNVGEVDAVVISSAIRENNVELKDALDRKIKVYQRAQMLALIAQGKKVVAVSGTHGKTTTTSMISSVFEKNNLDPTFLIGGELNDIGSNARHGQSEYFIAETDESDGSLLNFDPDLLVITNIEADHLDYFDTFEEIQKLFTTFVGKIRKGGKAIVYADHPNIKTLIPFIDSKVITYGQSRENEYYFDSYRQESFGSSFLVYRREQKLGEINLPMPGEHNALNALASIVVALEEGLTFKQVRETLAKFSGVKRRFQLLGEKNKASFYDDYAHHPTEIEATLTAASREKKGRLICVFQPHRYSRTSLLASEFGSSFDNADVIVITDVYGAGETPIPGVSGKTIADAVLESNGHKQVAYMPTLKDVISFMQKEVKPGDLVLTMGAGDISSIGQKLLA